MARCRYMRDDDYCVVRAIVISKRDARLTPVGEGAYAECERCRYNPNKAQHAKNVQDVQGVQDVQKQKKQKEEQQNG